MKKNERTMLLSFLSPIVIVYFVIFAYPTLRTFYMSFFKMQNLATARSEWTFVGLSNYMELFKNPLFMTSYLNIALIGIVGGVVVFVVALFFAVTIHSKFKGHKILRAIVYMPNIITPVALITMWRQYVFNIDYGLFHKFFAFFHLDALANIPWTSSEWAFRSMMVAFCFGSVGYYMIIYQSAMDKIPDDYYDYAALEGASKFYMFRRITMPLLVDTTRTAVTFWAIGAINFFLWSRLFNVNPLDPSTIVPANLMFGWVFGNSGGGSGGSTPTNVGGGCAIGVVLTLSVVIVFALINNLGSKEHYEY